MRGWRWLHCDQARAWQGTCLLTRGGDTGVADAPVQIALQAHRVRRHMPGVQYARQMGYGADAAAAAWRARGYGPGYVPGACQGRVGRIAWGCCQRMGAAVVGEGGGRKT